MKFELFKDVALAVDIPEHRLKEGDMRLLLITSLPRKPANSGMLWRFSIQRVKLWRFFLSLPRRSNHYPIMRCGMKDRLRTLRNLRVFQIGGVNLAIRI